MIISAWDTQELCVDLVDSLVFTVLTNQPQPRLSDKQTYLQRIKLRPEPFPKSINRLLIIDYCLPKQQSVYNWKITHNYGRDGISRLQIRLTRVILRTSSKLNPPPQNRQVIARTGHLLRPPGWTQIRLKNSQLLPQMNQSGVHLPPVERHFNYRYATWALLSQWPVSVIGNDDWKLMLTSSFFVLQIPVVRYGGVIEQFLRASELTFGGIVI